MNREGRGKGVEGEVGSAYELDRNSHQLASWHEVQKGVGQLRGGRKTKPFRL